MLRSDAAKIDYLIKEHNLSMDATSKKISTSVLFY